MDGSLAVTLAEPLAVDATVTITVPAPLTATDPGCTLAPVVVCTLILPAGQTSVSLPVSTAAVTTAQVLTVPVGLSVDGYLPSTADLQVTVVPAQAPQLPWRYTTTGQVSTTFAGGAWLENGVVRTPDDTGMVSAPGLVTATVTDPAAVRYARLYWAGHADGPSQTEVTLTGPDLVATQVTGTPLALSSGGSAWPNSFVTSADVTAAVRAHGFGTWSVSVPEFAAPRGSLFNQFGGWVLVVVVDDPAAPNQVFSLGDGAAVLEPGQAGSSFDTTAAAGSATATLVGFGGDPIPAELVTVGTTVMMDNAFTGTDFASLSGSRTGIDVVSVPVGGSTDPLVVTAQPDRLCIAVLATSTPL